MQYIIYIIYIFKYLFCGIPHVHFRVNTFRGNLLKPKPTLIFVCLFICCLTPKIVWMLHIDIYNIVR